MVLSLLTKPKTPPLLNVKVALYLWEVQVGNCCCCKVRHEAICLLACSGKKINKCGFKSALCVLFRQHSYVLCS